MHDVRLALRALRRAPGFAAAAMLSLAIGIGANTALYSVVDALLLRPLPYADAERLVILWNRSPGLNITEDWFSTAQYFDIRTRHTGFEDVALAIGANANLAGDWDPQRVGVIRASSNLLTMLGAEPLAGRLFEPANDVPGGGQVAVLSYGLFARRYGADRSIVGKTIRLDGRSYEVIGVLPEGFSLPHEVLPTLGVVADADVLLPLPLAAAAANVRTAEDYNIVGKLKRGVTVAAAQTEMDGITARLRSEHPDVYPPGGGLTFGIVPLLEQVVGDVRRPLLVLTGAVAFVLLIACANVASLLLSRAVVARREWAVRAALGASRARIIRQQLTESLLLAGAGSLLGVGLAWIGIRALHALQPPNVPRLGGISLNATVLAVTAGLTMLSVLIFGVAPALGAVRIDVQRHLKPGDRGSAGTGSMWASSYGVRRVLVAAELALAVVLLIGAGLLVRSFAQLQQVPTGFRTDHVLSFELALTGSRYPDADSVRRAYRELWDRIEALPGVEAVGGITALPLSDRAAWGPITVEGKILPAGQSFINADMRTAGGRYFETMGIELVEGRLFTDADRAALPGSPQPTARVAIVDDRMARDLWPGESAVGKRFHYGDAASTSPWETVVGVVRQVKHYGLDAEARIALYRPQSQSGTRTLFTTIRTQGDPRALVRAVNDAIRAIDPDLPMTEVATMAERLERSMARRTFSTWLLSLLAVVAVVLAAIGVYGVMAYMVAQGRRDLGIRIALGATPRAIVSLVLRHGLTVAAAGVVIGLAAAAGLTRLMAGLLFAVGPTDVVTFAVTAVMLAGIAIAAMVIPAARAARVDPIQALRSE
jgi:putative ABC transport system permease protein